MSGPHHRFLDFHACLARPSSSPTSQPTGVTHSARVPSIWLVVAAALALGACSRRPPLVMPSENARLPEERQPPAVAVDPAPELPPSSQRAQTTERLVALRSPQDEAAALEVVHQFFEVTLDGSLAGLERLLDKNARLRTSHRGRRESIQSAWQRRFRALDYTALKGQLLYRASDVELYRAGDLEVMRPARLLALHPSDAEVVVRVPISSPSHGATRFFGDDIVFLLRPSDEGYKIGEVYEDFRLP